MQDACLLRFLKARQYNVDLAYDMASSYAAHACLHATFFVRESSDPTRGAGPLQLVKCIAWRKAEQIDRWVAQRRSRLPTCEALRVPLCRASWALFNGPPAEPPARLRCILESQNTAKKRNRSQRRCLWPSGCLFWCELFRVAALRAAFGAGNCRATSGPSS